MSCIRILGVLAYAVSIALAEASAGGTNAPASYVEGEVIVTFKPAVDLPGARRALRGHALEFGRHFDRLSRHYGRQMGLIRAPGRTTAGLIAELKRDPAIATAEPNYLRWVTGGRLPNDALFGQLWGLHNTGQSVQGAAGTAGDDIKFTEAWALARNSSNAVVVAVIDTGVEYTHPDLAPNMWHNPGEIPGNGVDDDGNGYVDDWVGYDFASGNGDPADSGTHGTHVSGTIAAVGNNQLGVIGVDYRAQIMALRVSNDGTSMDSVAIIEALQYATTMKQQGVNIVAINASYGGPGSSSVERAAYQAAGDAGIIVCAAAGNDSADNDTISSYPAAYRLPNMVVVAATDSNDHLASFSNYGLQTVDLGAPGVRILSTAVPGMTSWVQVASMKYDANALEYSGSTAGITATIYDCGLGNPADFPAAVQGNIALIQRGTLYFSEKVSNATAAGATAAIIYNNVAGGFAGTLQTSGDWIPAVSISQADGQALLAQLPITGTVGSTPDPNAIYRYLEGTSMATPHVAGAVAFAAMNFPDETVAQRVQRLLANVDPVPGLAGKVRTGGRLNLLRTVDTDGNSLPDWWEQTFFGHLTGTDPNADPDHDGFANGEEFLADTDPTNASSVLRLTRVQPLPTGTRLEWTAGAGARLYLQRHAAFDSQSAWTDILTNDPPTASAGAFLDPFGTNSAFYRLRAERP